MRTEQVHTLILGAGPSGLAAGYVLAKAGLKPVVLERDKVPGGLMRSIPRGDFVVDVGRKELYNRLAKVDEFWSQLLGSDYRDYPHRGGILYNGHIIDLSPAFQGFRRGMPLVMFGSCCLDFLTARIRGGNPQNLEEYFYVKRGRKLTRIFSQGFQEKLTGKLWAELPVPHENNNGSDGSFLTTLKALVERTFSKQEVNTYKGIWRHPAKGTGQICDALAQGIRDAGGRIEFQARVLSAESTPNGVETVTTEIGSEQIAYKPAKLVSSIPLEILAKLLLPQYSNASGNRPKALDQRRTVVLVYLFLNEEPHFPQAWLQVTCPKTRIGRITNYAAFNGDMVPHGKTSLCCELYCFGEDPLLQMKDDEILDLTLDYLSQMKLADRARCFDHLVLRLPGADASQNRDNWMSKERIQLLSEFNRFENLYYVNRTETDIATLAGIEAAEAIVSGDRTGFDRRVDPAELNIRSESKAFAFA
ncbi:MAG TPA: FAD-dependent oxidoreductase [Verrucomicrobiae bacterium]|nr:FAD-dependent oxidoreductase [Verrucomicrobiae bacterium]